MFNAYCHCFVITVRKRGNTPELIVCLFAYSCFFRTTKRLHERHYVQKKGGNQQTKTNKQTNKQNKQNEQTKPKKLPNQ
jgi:hypothetical protein